jgi:hypothetical protein
MGDAQTVTQNLAQNPHAKLITHSEDRDMARRGRKPLSEYDAAGAPYRRARGWAWSVFWLTAGSSVLYNCYHALVMQHMPWYTGVPEGFVPLGVAIGVLEFAAAWRASKLLQAAAWLVTAGAMAWSAFATNSVVHNGWAFGLICDTAALAAMYFLLNGPRAQAAIDAVTAEVARYREAADRAAAGKAEAEESARRMVAETQTAVSAQVQQLSTSHAEALAGLNGELSDARQALTRALEQADEALTAAGRERALRAEAERSAATIERSATEGMSALREELERVRGDLLSAQGDSRQAISQVGTLTAQLERARAARKQARTGTAAPARQQEESFEQATNKLAAIMHLRDNPEDCAPGNGAKLAEKIGCSKQTGRRLLGQLTENGQLKEEHRAPADADAR